MAFNDSNVLAVNSDGRLFHAIRRLNGSWTQFGDVETQAGDRGTLTQVAAAEVLFDGDLHVLAVNSDGRLWHTVRRVANGQWTELSDVEVQTGDMGKVASVAAAVAFGNNLHVLAVNTDGRLWHTIRTPSGTWLPIGDVEGQVGEMGKLAHVAAAFNGNELHVVAVNSDGRLWHTIRTDFPHKWTPFGDVEQQTSEVGVIKRVAAALDGFRLHVVAVNSDGKLWHTIRQSLNGPWTAFGDVEPQTTEIGTIKTAAISR